MLAVHKFCTSSFYTAGVFGVSISIPGTLQFSVPTPVLRFQIFQNWNSEQPRYIAKTPDQLKQIFFK